MFRLFEEDNPFKVEKSLKLLGLNIKDNKKQILNEISKYLFNPQNGGIQPTRRNFDINYDYKYYFVDFLKFGINLNKQDIDWWEFNSVLDGIMLNDNSVISTVIGYRVYEKPSENPKVRESKHHQYMMEMKQKYRLPSSNGTTDGFQKLWNYVEKKAGETKE